MNLNLCVKRRIVFIEKHFYKENAGKRKITLEIAKKRKKNQLEFHSCSWYIYYILSLADTNGVIKKKNCRIYIVFSFCNQNLNYLAKSRN